MTSAPLEQPLPPKPRLLGLRLAAAVETGVLIAIILLLDRVVGTGDRFFHVEPSPFWIPVLLVAAQYGLEEALFAAAAASVALLLFNVPPPAQGADAIAHAATMARNPAMWTLGALLVGGLAERHLRRAALLDKNLRQLSAETATLTETVERLAQSNEALETRIAGQLATFASLYEAAKAVERESPGQVLIGAARLVRSALNAKEFSIYLLNNGVLEAALCEGWGAAENRARHFASGAPLFDHVVARRATVHVGTQEGEALLGQQGLMAGPILNPLTGAVRGMVKVERMAFEDFTPTAVHNFRVLCDWLGAALSRAEDIKRAREMSLMGGDGTLLSRRLLSRFEDLLARLAERENFALAALDVDVAAVGQENVRAMPRLIAGASAEALRATDLAFESADANGCCVLLPGAGETAARAVGTRLYNALSERLREAEMDATVSITVRLIEAVDGRIGGDGAGKADEAA